MDKQYKPRNYLKNVTFTLLNTNRGNWKWFRLETILNNIDMKKASWVKHVISLNRQYKPRNYLKNVTLTLLNTNRGNWKWFRLETILNNIDMKKASWVNHVIILNSNTSLETILKMLHLPYLTRTEVTESDKRLETIIINNKIKKHRDLTIENARIDNTRLETILNM